MMKPVTIIGMGLSPGDLTETHKEMIRHADILMGGERHLSYFKDTPAIKRSIGKDLKEAVAFIRSHMEKSAIVVLASGDPLFFGIGSVITGALDPDQVEIMPNISSIAAAFARIKEPWSHAKIISLHGRNKEAELLEAVNTHDRVGVFTDPKKNPTWLAGFLIERDAGDIQMGVFEKLGTPEEKTGWYALAEAAALVFEEPNVIILKGQPKKMTPALPLHLGMEEADFEHERGLITKSEIRAVTLAKLRLLPHHILWDLGAGSGSVAIEAALFLNKGKIFAIEQKAERVNQIKTNITRFGVTNIEAMSAVLPEGLNDLPAPDRVFVGGGGRDLDRIIAAVAPLIKPDGVMVINAVLLDNLETAVKALKKSGFQTEVIQVQIQHSRAMPWSERFEAQNPVWIITGKK